MKLKSLIGLEELEESVFSPKFVLERLGEKWEAGRTIFVLRCSRTPADAAASSSPVAGSPV